MYHRLTTEPGEYDMTPGGFRAQVRRLLRSDYRPVDARGFARGRVDVPAGATPVVLTFDDSTPGQFALRSDGRLDPECAAGILAAECAKVPGAEPRATFYINKEPFGLESEREQRRSLQALLKMGFGIGNHSFDHANLATLSDAGVAEQLVRLQQLVTRLVPEAEVATLALPFGVSPRRRRLAERGSWRGTSYAFDLTLLVGANPSPSPFDADFDPHRVPRIRGTSWQGGNVPLTGTYWLDYLEARPQERYVSAGNPGHVTVPKKLRSQVADRYRERLITY
jgi:Polysaccharide deacetylase